MTTVRFVTRLALALAVVLALAPRAHAQNPFTIDGNVPDAGTLRTPDPAGNTSELSPLNGANYKLGVIHLVGSTPSNPLPVLGFTTQPSKVDLNAVWTQVKKAADGDQWFYFGWSRDAPNGSGFISIEMQHAAAPAACNYSGANIDMVTPVSPAEQALIDNCNPWANRQAGDFLILWDQVGSVIEITKRVFSADPIDGHLVLGAPVLLTGIANPTAFAALAGDELHGEVAVDLTKAVFGDQPQCTTIANMIPNTLTGNSDTADYKDTVLAAFPPISNCGLLDVKKVTQDPNGNSFAGTGSFPYTIARQGGGDLRYQVDFPNANDLKQLTGTLTNTTTTDSYDKLISGGDYTLVEGSLSGTPWTLVSILCTVGDGTVSPYLTTQYPSGSIPVAIGETTHCVITNKYVAASPAAGTTPSASFRVFDSASIVGLVNLGTLPTTGTFRLYSDANCQNQVSGSPVTATVTYPQTFNGTATSDTGMTGIAVQAGTYYWTFTYAGNAFNSGFTTSCGSEVITVGATITSLPTPIK